jgi:hypothetical protein
MFADISISSNIIYALIGVGFVVYVMRKAGHPDRIKFWGVEITFRDASKDQNPP